MTNYTFVNERTDAKALTVAGEVFVVIDFHLCDEEEQSTIFREVIAANTDWLIDDIVSARREGYLIKRRKLVSLFQGGLVTEPRIDIPYDEVVFDTL